MEKKFSKGYDFNVKELFRELTELFEKRIVFIDGAMGTVIQKYKLQEEDYRGEIYKDHKVLLKNNNDVLNVTMPDLIRQIHLDYLEAGSDIIETNTFNATSISLADFAMEDLAYEFNFQAAKLAREATDKVTFCFIFLNSLLMPNDM